MLNRAPRTATATLITSAPHLLLLLVGVRIGTPTGWLCVLALIGGISLLFAGVANFRRSRAVADTPTSRVASAPQGYVELCGRRGCIPGTSVIAPLTAPPCVWYRYRIEEKSGKNWSAVRARAERPTPSCSTTAAGRWWSIPTGRRS